MKTLLLGSLDSSFYKSIESAWPYLNVQGSVSEHTFSKAAEIVDFAESNGYRRVLMPNPYGNNRRLNCYKALKQSSIQVITSDRGALPGSWFFDQGFNADSPSYQKSEWDIPLTEQQQRFARNYIEGLKRSSEALEKNGPRKNGENLREFLQIGADTTVVFVPLQRPNDTVIKFMSEPVKSVVNFIRWVEQAAQILEHRQPNRKFIFLLKKHPLESDYIAIQNSHDQVKYISSSVHVHDLIEASDAVLLINSGVGVLSLAFGKTTICTGKAFYCNDGLAVSAKSADEIANLLLDPPIPDSTSVDRFYLHLLDRVYSFGSQKTSLIREKDGTRNQTTEINFDELRVLGRILYKKNEAATLARADTSIRKRKVLFVVPLSPIPIYRGNQARLHTILVQALARDDLEVHMCIMNRSFPKLRSVDYARTVRAEYPGLKSVVVVKGSNYGNSLASRLEFYAHKIHSKTLGKNDICSLTDCPPRFRRAVSKQIMENSIDNLFLVYAMTAATIPNDFKGHVVIDTHDYQYNHLVSDQKENGSRLHIDAEKFKTSEIRFLNKANSLISINPKETEIFKTFFRNPDKIITIPQFFPELHKNLIQFWSHSYDAVFVGSAANFNVSGLIWFLKEVYPKILKRRADFTLAIVGDVCRINSVKDAVSACVGIEMLGRVESISQVYSESKIVLAPILGGAGMKIKVIEALGFGKCLIATSPALDGIDTQGFAPPALVADNAEQFASAVINASSNADLRLTMENSALAFFKAKHSEESQRDQLEKVFDEFIPKKMSSSTQALSNFAITGNATQ